MLPPHGPHDPSELIRHGHRCDIAPAPLFGLHGPLLQRRRPAAVFACQTTERAPCVRSMRTYTSPRLLMAPSRRRDPLESSFGVKPRKLAKCRPDGKRRMSATSATNAVAVITPTPGTVCKSVTSAISDASAPSCRSTARIFVSSISISSQAAARVVCNSMGTGVGSTSSSRTRGMTCCAPTGMKRPNSRSRPRSVLSRAVRVASQVDRRRCNEAMACCSIVLTGTA